VISRVVLCVMMGGVGLNNLIPDEPKPLTSAQLQIKAKEASVSAVCKKKTKSKTVQDLCKRWEKHDA